MTFANRSAPAASRAPTAASPPHRQPTTRALATGLMTLALLALAPALTGCGSDPDPTPVHIADQGSNAVSLWGERAAATINQPPAASGTPEERRPVFQLDLATLHLAMHRAVSAASPAAQVAAAHAAGYAVLKTLYPQRSGTYQATYDTAVAALPADADREEGLRIGAEQAASVLARRADDGRWASFVPAVPGTAPGAFRGKDSFGQFLPLVRPFVLDSIAQFRSAPPPALDGAVWAADLEETRRRGAANGSASAREDEIARFHTMAPPLYWTHNLNRLARSQASLAENARLMAVLWVTQADATSACFESKYHYKRWRPQSAIEGIDPAWTPRVATPNHPEYPAAHGCTTAALAESLAEFFGTRQVRFAFDSTITGSTHAWETVDAAVEEVREARILGGMHFRASNVAGETLGAQVGRWVAQQLDTRW